MEPLKHDEQLVSIGMPVYNGERYIRKALDSLLEQDYEHFEFIISDNASTDSTLQICREYASSDHRISIHTQNYNAGALANFKTVLELARGNYFMWAADDDRWLPEFISSLVKELKTHPEAGVAMCGIDRVHEDGILFDTIQFKDKDDPNNMTYYQMMKGLTSFRKYNIYIYGLFRTDLLRQAISFFPEVPGVDRLFICQMALATRFRYVDRVLHIRMQHNQPSNIRLPDEIFNRMQEDKLVDIKILLALINMILKSTIIPWYRKFYLPVILWRYVWLLLQGRFEPSIIQRVSPDIRNRLKKIKKLFLPR
ncbi:MAG: glycosyltransferase family 2 protein [Dehalococcoidia bacterium]